MTLQACLPRTGRLPVTLLRSRAKCTERCDWLRDLTGAGGFDCFFERESESFSFRRASMLAAFRFRNGILAPLGNSTNRRTNSPQLSTIYFVPAGKRRGSWYTLLT